MSILVSNLQSHRKNSQLGQVQARKISYRANSNSLEKTPQTDVYDNKKSKKKTLKVIGGILVAAAVMLGIVCFQKGKPADGVKKNFFERINDGWKKLINKSETALNKAEEEAKTVEDAVTKSEKEVEIVSKADKQHLGEKDSALLEDSIKAEEHVTNADVDKNIESLREVRTPEQEDALQKINTEAAEKSAEASTLENNAVIKPLKQKSSVKLDFEIQVGNDKVIVENGKIKKCINSAGEEWHINDKTDEAYAKKIHDAVAEEVSKRQK